VGGRRLGRHTAQRVGGARVVGTAVVALPAAVAVVLLLVERWDRFWQHDVTHFWLVGLVSSVSTALSVAVSQDARRRGDARLFLVSLACTASSGFLGLHALATPGVVMDASNTGFEAAVPVGLLVASAFAAASAIDLTPLRAARILERAGVLRATLLVLIAGWAVATVAQVRALEQPLDTDASALDVVGVLGTVLFVAAAARYLLLQRERRSSVVLAFVVAFTLLAESMVVAALADNWRYSWWEWHLLIVGAFGYVASSAYGQAWREGTPVGVFDPLSLDETIRSVRADYSAALEALVDAVDTHGGADGSASIADVAAAVGRQFDLTERQVAVLTQSAEALRADRDQLQRLGVLVAIGACSRVGVPEAELVTDMAAAIDGGFRDDDIRLVFALRGDPLVEHVAAVGEPAMTPDHRRWVLPLTVQGATIGVLDVRRREPRPPTERDDVMFRSLASHASIVIENARLYRQLEGLFRTYMSPAVAAELIANPSHAALGGEIREVSVLMADLAGFTSWSERVRPDEVMAMLNEYFSAVVPVILERDGTVVQFVGDQVMAVFGAPSNQPDHARRAADAALALQVAASALHDRHPDWPRFRVGVNTGPALVGNVGSREMRNFTAIGDTTNLTARLQALAPEGGVVVGDDTARALGAAATTTPLEAVVVKGKAAPVQAHLLHGLPPA
jgi:class 3 adenylate cyclase